MSEPFPIGKREDQTLEFKAADALKNPSTIAREVVAMLNAQGGEVWVGMRDQDDVATSVDSIRDVEVAKKSLLDHLVSVIDPKPQSGELSIEVVTDGERKALRIRVTPIETSKPYAFTKDGALHFVMRIDHRVRAMTRDEIIPSRRTTSSPGRLAVLSAAAWTRAGFRLWLGLAPNQDLGWNIQDDALANFIRDARLSGNRHVGWTFVRRNAGSDPTREIKQGRREFGYEDSALTTLHDNGCIEFFAALDWLRNSRQPPKEINPIALIESVTSILRLARALYERAETSKPSSVSIDWLVTGLNGWTLPPYPPDTYGYEDSPARYASEVNLTPRRGPMAVPMSVLHDNPDRLAFNLVREIYEAFGLTEQQVPMAYDRKTQRLTLPE